MLSRIHLSVYLLTLLVGCSSGSGDDDDPAPSYSITLDFERLTTISPNPFIVNATVRENGALKSGAASDLTIVLSKGTRNAISEVSPGLYRFTVTPTQTGEHEVSVSYESASITRTPLVVDDVHADWGQPESVPGLVNTAGYEDGVTITPDGEYLFVQYGPIYFSGIFLFNALRANGGCEGNRLEFPMGTPNRCTHEWIDSTIGPYSAPERPGFFDGRFSGTTQLHNANSWGVGIEEAPLFAPTTMFYGFRKQADGTFTEPFYLAFDDVNDGIINAFGLSFMMHGDGTATALFTLDDPSDPDMVDLDGDMIDDVQSYFDVYTTEVTMGQNNILGTFIPSGTAGTPPVRGTPFPAQLVNFGQTGLDGIAGTQGNSHLYETGGNVLSIWTDDEHDTGGDHGELSVYVLTSGTFPIGTWTKVVLPTVINIADPSDEIQPFFTGNGLYFTRISNSALPQIYYTSYSGTHSELDFDNAGNWGTPEVILSVTTADAVGKGTAIGEPTIANVDGTEYLYFVYGIIRGYDATSGLTDIDMQAGFVKKN